MTSTMKLSALLMLCCAFAAGGCSTAPKDESAKDDLTAKADRTLDQILATDPSIRERINEAHAYAVFPSIGKGGAGVGGAFGRGVVYEQGRPMGYASMTQASFGFQLGGQTFSEVVLFDRQAFDKFRKGQFSLDAQASGVAVTAGAARTAQFRDGVMVFVLGEKGLMYEAAIAGQKFNVEPM